MKIQTVTYRATVTPVEYPDGGGMTRHMEATAELTPGVCPDIELAELVDYVHVALGKPTMAQAKAARLLRDVDALWMKIYGLRSQVESDRESAKSSRETAVRQREQAGDRQDNAAAQARTYAEGSERSAAQAEERATRREEQAAKLQAQAEEREQEPAVRAARELLRRPKPEPDVPADNNYDDIPF